MARLRQHEGTLWIVSGWTSRLLPCTSDVPRGSASAGRGRPPDHHPCFFAVRRSFCRRRPGGRQLVPEARKLEPSSRWINQPTSTLWTSRVLLGGARYCQPGRTATLQVKVVTQVFGSHKASLPGYSSPSWPPRRHSRSPLQRDRRLSPNRNRHVLRAAGHISMPRRRSARLLAQGRGSSR